MGKHKSDTTSSFGRWLALLILSALCVSTLIVWGIGVADVLKGVRL